MAKTAIYIQKGDALDYTNSTEATIPANTVVLLGKRIGVTGGDILPKDTGSLHMQGVFDIPKKASVAITAGDNVVFTDTDGINKATADVMGYAVETVAAEATTVKVKLIG